MSNTLSDLLKRVEEAKGPDRQLDKLVLCALAAPQGSVVKQSPFNQEWCIYAPSYGGKERLWEWPGWFRPEGWPVTSSLDSALSLVERMLPGWHWRAGRGSERPGWAHLNRLHPDHCDRKDEATGYAATPTLALLSALLRALISQDRT